MVPGLPVKVGAYALCVVLASLFAGAPSPGRAQQDGPLYTCAAAEAADAAALTSTRTVDEQVITVALPAVVECLPALKEQIRLFLETYEAQSVHFGAEYSDTEREEFLAMAREAREGGFAWSHDIAITQEFGNEHLVSLLASVWSYSGGAHGNLFFAPIVFDTVGGKSLALDDFFEAGTPWLQTVASFVREDLYRQKRQMGTFDSTDGEDPFIDEGTAPDPGNFQAFGVYGDASGDARGLTFHFAPYSVGAFAEGDFHVKVPAVVFDAYLRSEWRRLFQ